MKVKVDIKNNKVYLIRFIFFKMIIGKYADGMIVFNESFKKLLDKDNPKNVNILRKTF